MARFAKKLMNYLVNELCCYRAIELMRLGQSTLEIIIAFTVLTIGLTSAVLVIFSSQSISLDSFESNQALRLAEQQLENARAFARGDFNELVSSSSTQNEFTKELIVQNTGTSTKMVTSRVSWSTDPQRVQKVELVTTVTDWANVAATGGNTGGGGTSGNWTNPRTLGSINLGPNEQATDLDVLNYVVYMTTSVSAANKPTFFIVDATNGQSPVIDASLNTGNSLNAVSVAKNYAYVANNKTTSQLQIIDVSSNTNPSLVSSFTLPGVSGSGAVGNSILYYNARAYIGTKQATGPEFHVVDVSNVQSPVELGSFKVSGNVNAIALAGNTAYLATSNDAAELIVLDVSNPASIMQIGSYDAPGNYAGQSLVRVGSIVYFGRQTGGSDELRVLNVSHPSSITSLGSANIGATVSGIDSRDNLVFLGLNSSNDEFQVWDASNPATLTEISSFNFPNFATGVDYENNYVYASVRSNDGLRIITSQ